MWNLKRNIYFYVRGGAPTHCGLWQVTQCFWVFDSSLVKCQVTASMPRQSISYHRFEWECLLSLSVWAVDFHQDSVSGCHAHNLYVRCVCVCVWVRVCVMVLKFDVQEDNLISKFVLLSDVRQWPIFIGLRTSLVIFVLCLCACASVSLSVCQEMALLLLLGWRKAVF